MCKTDLKKLAQGRAKNGECFQCAQKAGMDREGFTYIMVEGVRVKVHTKHLTQNYVPTYVTDHLKKGK